METVAIVGVGLIGASFGLALRKSGFSGEIIGVSSERALAAGLARKAITGTASLNDAVKRADLIYLAQPVDRILETIPLLAPSLRTAALVTDAGSTKEQIVAQASRYLPPGSFIGGHPIAGKEQRGPEAADPDLFRDRLYVLTPSDGNPAAGKFRLLIAEKLGARLLEMTPSEHDRTLAFTSHLPQLLSTALAAAAAREGNPAVSQVFGTGLLDMTRLAMSSPELWSSILATNQNHVSEALDSVIRTLEEIKAKLGEREIANTFEEGAAFASTIRRSI